MARLTGKALADWIQSNYRRDPSIILPCVPYPPVVPDSPNEIVVVTVTPGSPFVHEMTFETVRFQVRCRAPQNHQEIAEANSQGVDTFLSTLLLPTTINSITVMDIGHVGGGPAPMAMPDDAANRYSWVCNYWIRSATGF